MARFGLTIPLDGLSLRDHQEVLRHAEASGYSDVWTAEIDGFDGFTPLAVAAMATERMRLGVAIVSAFTRRPGTIAVTAAARPLPP
jgi:alkanesulfonate monooxygenase SsuD/methylene tetrahydromethanopterin reductase-like flavin-dependent oxidoreductase (luciferase family)